MEEAALSKLGKMDEIPAMGTLHPTDHSPPRLTPYGPHLPILSILQMKKERLQEIS